MNPEVKIKWLTRLREPERKQIKSYLEREGCGQCCLGVLSEIAHEEGVITREVSEGGMVTYGGNPAVLSAATSEWAGFGDQDENPFIRSRHFGEREVGSLAEANDAGMTFAEIADIIEKEF